MNLKNLTNREKKMNINKVKMVITLESTHLDSFESLVVDVMRQVSDEKLRGSFWHSDGDSAEWKITHEEIEV